MDSEKSNIGERIKLLTTRIQEGKEQLRRQERLLLRLIKIENGEPPDDEEPSDPSRN